MRISRIESVMPFRSLEITFLALMAYGPYTKCDIEGTECGAILDEIQLAFGLRNQDFICDRKFACLQSTLPQEDEQKENYASAS